MYTEERYRAFKADVPAAQRYVVNYVAWVADQPLLSAEKAEELDRHYGF